MRSHGLMSLADLPEPRTVGDMALLALALEAEAQRRLEAFVREAEAVARPEVLSLAAHLAGEHGGRCRRLQSDWAGESGEAAELKLPDTLLAQVFADEDAAVCDLYHLTPYGLLAFEVSAAQRRFALYSYLAAAAQDSAVHDLAEGCASKELALAAELRRERRRAYRRRPAAEAYPLPARTGSLAELVSAALFIEQALVERLTETARFLPALLATLEATRRQAEDLRRLASDLGGPGDDLFGERKEPDRPAPDAEPTDPEDARRLLAECERAFTFYDAVATAAANAETMLKAQGLSQAALERLKGVRAALPPGRDRMSPKRSEP